MPQPINTVPSNVDEETADPTVVDYPVQSEVIDLPAETTKADDIDDTGYIWDQSYPGDTQGMPKANLPIFTANRVTEVSDYILFGYSLLAGDTPPFILVPKHRDRLRVTVQVDYNAANPTVYLGSGPDIVAGGGWAVLSNIPITFDTRDAIYATTNTSANATRIQWAIELVSEGNGVGFTDT